MMRIMKRVIGLILYKLMNSLVVLKKKRGKLKTMMNLKN